MARGLNSASEIAQQRSEFVYLYEINHSGGVIRVTNSSHDITALSQTWIAVGGRLIHGSADDVSDRKAQGVELQLYGVNQQIISAIQNNQFRGHVMRIYLLHFDPDTGAQGTPDLIYQGRQNGDYRISESRDFDSTESGGVVTVSTRISADTAAINRKVSTRANVHSHEEMLRRSGVATPDDKFFSRVASLMNKELYWGTPAPENRIGSGRARVPDDDELRHLGWQ